MNQKLFNVLALYVACVAVAASAAGCGSSAPADRPVADAYPRAASLAPVVAATPSPNPSPNKVESPLPAPTGFVNDYAKVIDDETRRELEDKLRLLKARSNVEFAVATVETTGGQTIFDYSLAVARGWAIGSKETGDGLLLMLATRDRKWHIQLSRSLEAVLPKETLAKVGMRANPLYREGKHGAGIVKCVDGLIAVLAEKKGFKWDEATVELTPPRK